jgi:hypothetical protein
MRMSYGQTRNGMALSATLSREDLRVRVRPQVDRVIQAHRSRVDCRVAELNC